MPGKTNPTTTAVDAGYGSLSHSARIALNAAYCAASEKKALSRTMESIEAPWRAEDLVEVGEGLAALGLEVVAREPALGQEAGLTAGEHEVVGAHRLAEVERALPREREPGHLRLHHVTNPPATLMTWPVR